jgi:hypothetical protein
MTKFYAIRSHVSSGLNSYDRSMAHEQLGPFDTRDEAIGGLSGHLLAQWDMMSPILREQFASQFINLLSDMANPGQREIGKFYAPECRWDIKEV